MNKQKEFEIEKEITILFYFKVINCYKMNLYDMLNLISAISADDIARYK